MSGIASWLWGTPQIDEAVEKATSELLPAGEEDIALNLEICDQIRSKAAPANATMRALKRRLNHKNPNVQLLALGLTDICVKNGGDHFLAEVASREFMDNLVSILKVPILNNDVKNTILRLVQNWSVAFEGKPSLGYVGQVYKTLTNEGYKFPPKDLAAANSAMVDTSTAPEWIDSDVCLRCRTAFSFTNRKHHCRNCGQVFDHQCSSKSLPLPHFGIAQDVRVCDGCHAKLTKKAEKSDKPHRHSTGSRYRSGRELADEELQRAIQMSLQESGKSSGRPGYVPSQAAATAWQASEPPLVDRNTYPRSRSTPQEEMDDPDLRAAIEASLREASAPKPSAPIGLETPRVEHSSYSFPGDGYNQPRLATSAPAPSIKLPNYDLEPVESDAILTFSQTVEQVEAQGGRELSRYPGVNELYDKANSVRPKLAMSLDDTGKKEELLTDMHNKMSQIVKLYDNLLTEQVSHPRWRSPAAASPPLTHQPATSSYSTGYNTVNGYSQWSAQPQQQTAPVAQQHYAAQQPIHQGYYQQSPQDASRQQYGYLSAPPAPPQQQQHHMQPQSPEPQFQYTNPSSSSYQPHSAPAHSEMQQPQMQYQPTYISPATIPSLSPAPVPQSPPIPQVASPPPPPGLSRQNTVSYAPSAPQAHASQLGRSNTIAHPHDPRFQQQRQAPVHTQPQAQYHAPPPQLPQFPAVPTAAPQPTYDMYNSPIPQQPERKEALLIDL